MLRLYYNGVLTILTCRRIYADCDTTPCYLTVWPRRGEGSVYLAWELNCTSGILARLDPKVLKELWLLLAQAPELAYQVTSGHQLFQPENHRLGVLRAPAQPLQRGAPSVALGGRRFVAGRDSLPPRRFA